jgi:transcriptional regulator with XRE-family HTH domain
MDAVKQETRAAQARKAAGYTQEQVAKILRISRSTVSDSDHDGGQVGYDTLENIAMLYRCGVDVFLPTMQGNAHGDARSEQSTTERA